MQLPVPYPHPIPTESDSSGCEDRRKNPSEGNIRRALQNGVRGHRRQDLGVIQAAWGRSSSYFWLPAARKKGVLHCAHDSRSGSGDGGLILCPFLLRLDILSLSGPYSCLHSKRGLSTKECLLPCDMIALSSKLPPSSAPPPPCGYLNLFP
jgi:hypothetical protein